MNETKSIPVLTVSGGVVINYVADTLLKILYSSFCIVNDLLEYLLQTKRHGPSFFLNAETCIKSSSSSSSSSRYTD